MDSELDVLRAAGQLAKEGWPFAGVQRAARARGLTTDREGKGGCEESAAEGARGGGGGQG